MSPDMQPWHLDCNLAKFDGSGVKDFLSPYSMVHLDDILQQLYNEIWTGQYLATGKQDRNLQVIRALTPRWCTFILYLLQMRATKNRSIQENRKPIATAEAFPTLLKYLNNETLPDHAQLAYIQSGPKPVQPWYYWPIRAIRWWNKPIKRLPKSFLSENKTLTTAYFPTMAQWLVKENIRPLLWEPAWFFSSISDASLAAAKPDQTIDKIVDLVLNRAAEFNITLEKQDTDWLHKQLATSLAAAHIHVQHLLDNNLTLPKRLLSGASGSIWDRLMRIAVKERGGEVVGFEHGCGLAFQGTVSPYYADWFLCDRYVTMTRQFVELIENCKYIYQDLDLKKPILDPASHDHVSSKTNLNSKQRPRDSQQNPTILFVPFGASGERARGDVLPSDITGLDFNARCVQFLKDLGFNVIIKPHPATQGPDLGDYKRNLGIDGTSAPFETVLDQCDLVLTCDPRSTTTISTLSAGYPLVILDIAVPPISKPVLSWIGQKTEVVTCFFSKEERIEFDPAQLETAIKRQL